MPLFLLDLDRGEDFASFAIVESNSHETAPLKAREMWDDVDGIWFREVPSQFQVPAKLIDMRISKDIAEAIMEQSGIAKDDWWIDIPGLDPNDPTDADHIARATEGLMELIKRMPTRH